MGVSNINNNFKGIFNNPWAANGQVTSPNGQFPSPNGQFPSPNEQFLGTNEQFPFVNSRFLNTNNGCTNLPNSQQSGFLNQMPNGGPINEPGFADNQARPWWRK